MTKDSKIRGSSKSVKDLRLLIEKVAITNSTVLVLGETGTGKELVAEEVHISSTRSGPFIPVNCAAIPKDLLESELFGHEKGSFTGADKTRIGRFEMSSKGTLFLDEIGDIPLSLQSKLLRALESKSIQRVGGGKDIPIDLRLVCATHQNLENKVDNGSFRSDLYYRINVFPINVPTLAERAEDIPIIIDYMLKNLNLNAKNIPKFSNAAIQSLKRHLWPGNIRELKNIVERAVVMFPNKEISANNITENLLRLKLPSPSEEREILWEDTKDLSGIDLNENKNDRTSSPLQHPKHYADWFEFFDDIDLRIYIRDVEIVLIESALNKSNGTVAKAAELLKINRTTLIEKMKKLQIKRLEN